MAHTTEEGTVDWIADAVVLPAGSQWDTSVRILSSSGETEISRQRFAFSLSDDVVDEGRVTTLLDPITAVAAALLLGGALGLGLGLGGAPLPRCDAAASRIALVGGGTVATLLGALIGATRFG